VAAGAAGEKVASLVVTLFGPLAVLLHGAPLDRLRSRKVPWLLALLVLRQGREVERSWLATTLWPDSRESDAYYNLRRDLACLRRALGSEAARLHSPTAHTLCLDLTGAALDVVSFDAAIRRGDPPALERAVALYRGPLLEGCVEEWALQERRIREQAFLAALETLADQAHRRGDLGAAERYLRRAVTVDPLREGAQRALMQALAASGNFAAASEVYRELRLRLHRELNAEPDPETDALYQQLRAEARAKAALGAGRWALGGKASASRHACELPSDCAQRPAPSAQRRSKANLPLPLTRFIGREDHVAELQHWLAEHRLATLTGAGGCGKTRLALAVATELLATFPDGVTFVDLAPLTDPQWVPQAVATALGLTEEPGRSPADALRDFLESRHLLLVLDNCEHLLAACAHLVHSLLQSCPHLRVLATSREALGITGERTYRVPPLSLPGPQERPGVEQVTQYEAVRLFSDRATAVHPSFQVTAENVEAVTRICRRLEGMPLAIELAAARVKALPVEKLNERLDDMFRLLTGGNRTGLPRQQTLRALIDWSYDLLSPPEQTLLHRLSVFAGGWTLEAAEAVCIGEGVEEREVLDLLTRLVEQSLVLYEERGGEERYRLLETIRQYARDRLEGKPHEVGRGEAAEVRGRHRDWCLELAETAAQKLGGPEQAVWLERLETEHDNLRAALAWGLECGEAEPGLRLGVALFLFWATRGYWTEGRERLTALLGQPGAEARTVVRAKALHWSGFLADPQGDSGAARAFFEESLAISRELGHKPGIAESLLSLGWVVHQQGDSGAARAFFKESLAISRELDNKTGIAESLRVLAWAASQWGDYGEARALLEESLAIWRAVGNTDCFGFGLSLGYLGWVAHGQGNYGEARVLLEESLAIHREIDNKYAIASLLPALAMVTRDQGNSGEARALLEEALTISRKLGYRNGMERALEGLAGVAVAQAQPERAARLLGTAERLREAIGAPLQPGDRAEHDRSVMAVRAALTEDAVAAAWAEGRAMSIEQAIG
jgi:non-specific serine/threonine protein kinase